MALVTVHRSPSPICEHQQNRTQDASIVDGDGDNTLKPLSRNQSFSESYLTVKGAALILPQTECSRNRSCEPGKGDIQVHLQLMLYLLRVRDKLKLAVKLESKNPNSAGISANATAEEQFDPSSSSSAPPAGNVHSRYMALVSSRLEWPTSGREPAVESDVILGIDILDGKATIGLVLPVRGDVNLCLDGDGGFNVSTNGRLHNFKPVSVQAMWAALQSLIKARDSALPNAHLPLATLEGWINYYSAKIKSEASFVCEWHATLDSCSKDEGFLSLGSSAQRPVNAQLENTIRTKLKQVMMTVDLEEVTSKYLREKLEEDLGTSLYTWKRFIDDEMIIIMRQMDSPSEIFPYLYLGSEWNASNLEELQNNKVGYILNVTREIANFYPETFEYHNIRIFDEEDSDLLKHWENTHKFISRARDNHSKVLVHCKMGVSRSASTVIAFVMKEMKMNLQEAMKHVRSKRSCIQPNKGFRKQLEIYEGILDASKQRHSRLWQSSSSVDLQETLNSSQGTSRPTGMGPKFSPGSSSSSSSSPTSSTISCDQLRATDMDVSQVHVSSTDKKSRSEGTMKSHDRKRAHHASTSSDETNVFEPDHGSYLHPTWSSSSICPFSRENKSNCVLAKAKSFLSVYESSQNSKRVPPDRKPSFYSRSRSVSPKSHVHPQDNFRVSASDKRTQSSLFSETAVGGRLPKKQESFSLRVRPDNFWIRDEPLDNSDAGHNLRETGRSPIKAEVFQGSEISLLADLTPGKVKRTKHEIENRERIMSTSTISSIRQGKNAAERLSVSPTIHRSSSFKMERSKTKEFLGEKRKTYPLSKNQEDCSERKVDAPDGHESTYSHPKPAHQDDQAHLRKHSRSTFDIQSVVDSSVPDRAELSSSDCRYDREIQKGEVFKARKGLEDATHRRSNNEQGTPNHRRENSYVAQKPDICSQKSLLNSKCSPFGVCTSSGIENWKTVQPSPRCKRSLEFNEASATDNSSSNNVNRNLVRKPSVTSNRHSSACLKAEVDCEAVRDRSSDFHVRERCNSSGMYNSGAELRKASFVPSSETSDMLRKPTEAKSQIAGTKMNPLDKMRSEVNNCSKSVSSLYLELHHEASASQERGSNCRNSGHQNDSAEKLCPQKNDGTTNNCPHLTVTEGLAFPVENSLGSKAFRAVCQKGMKKVKSPVIFMPSVEPIFSTVPSPVAEVKPARRPQNLGVINLSISKSSGNLAKVGSEEISCRKKATLDSEFDEESSVLNVCSAVTPPQRSVCNFSVASAGLASAKSVTPVLCKSLAKEDLVGKDRNAFASADGNRSTSCSKPPTPTYHADQSLLCN